MTWFAFAGMNGGKAVNLAGTQEKQAVAEGFHGYGTEKQAETQPNSLNPFTRFLADAWIADYKAAVAEQAQPGGKNADITNPVTAAKAGAQGAATVAKDAANATGLGSVVDFLQGLTSANLWIRVSKVVIGGALLLVGVIKLTGADQRLGGLAAGAVKVAPLL